LCQTKKTTQQENMGNRQKIGKDFENELCEKLRQKGFWVHQVINNYGQNMDMIAVRNKEMFLIDAKHCSANSFPLSRVEENQISSAELFNKCWGDDEHSLFAFKFDGDEEIYFVVASQVIRWVDEGKKRGKKQEIVRCAIDDFW